MSRSYLPVAFTDTVLAAQARYGSRAAIDRYHRRSAGSGEPASPPSGPPDRPGTGDALTAVEREFVAELDGFYLSTVSETGWPYVQFRGGPAGFVRTPDEHTIAWADFRGNRQYISMGNLAHDSRAALIFMDHARQTRLKVYGWVSVSERPEGGQSTEASALAVPGYPGRVEREVRVDVAAYDWNCPQHITPRYSMEELAPLLRRVEDLEADNRRLREAAAGGAPATVPAP